MLKLVSKNNAEVLSLDSLVAAAEAAGLGINIDDDRGCSFSRRVTVKLQFKKKSGSWGWFGGSSEVSVLDAFIDAINEARDMGWKI